MTEIFEAILKFFTSENVAYFSTAIVTIATPIFLVVSKITNKKLKIKLDNKNEIIKDIEKKFKSYADSMGAILEELKAKYEDAEKTVQQVTDILDKQNDALKIAFDNSNLNASAKKLVGEILQRKKEETPTEPVTDDEKNEPIEEVVNIEEPEEQNDRGRIRRVV